MGSYSLAMLLSASTAMAAMAPAYGAATTTAPAYGATTTEVSAGSDCAKTCVEVYRNCQTSPGANQASCASALAGCVNYNPFDNSGNFVTPTACSTSAKETATAPPAYTTSASTSDCAKTCVAAYRTCQTSPDANQSSCASTLAGCLNYNPFENGSFITPTACSASGKETAPAYTAPAATTTKAAGGDECAAKCVATYRDCQTSPDANQSSCASALAGCLNYNPFENGSFVTPTACSASGKATGTVSLPAPVYQTAPAATTIAAGTPDACAAKCTAEFRACQADTSINRSTCTSNMVTCIGYNPFDPNAGIFYAPTACSKTAQATGAASGTVSLPAPVYQTAPAAATTTGATGGSDSCAAACVAAYRNCQTSPDANQSSCASTLAGCVNYNPFDNSGSFVTPTACSASGAATGAVMTKASNGTAVGTGSATYSAPAQYTGGASLMSGSFMAIAAGAVGLLF